MVKIDKKKIEELLTRGVNEIIDFNNLKKRLLKGDKLRVKLGIDPTSPNIHLGRAIPLLKLKDFQELGHKIIFIVGDFTGVIGDTSDKETERPMIAEEKIKENMKTYVKQAGKILDIKKTEIHYNSKWLKNLGYTEIGKQANEFSLAEFIKRENIKKRLDAGKRISLREVLYPLMQGYDSVAVKSDLEIGGTDQRFNLLAGRTLQSCYKQKPQDIMMNNLILGTDGRKMSSSWGNTINILEKPEEMFGKIMSIPDNLIISYFEHCSRFPIKKIREHEKRLLEKSVNPRDVKIELAYEITMIYWGKPGAEKGKKYFKNVFQEKSLPNKIKEIKASDKNIIDVLLISGLAKSKSEARRLLEQKAIKINKKQIYSQDKIVKKGEIIQKGKRYFIKVV